MRKTLSIVQNSVSSSTACFAFVALVIFAYPGHRSTPRKGDSVRKFTNPSACIASPYPPFPVCATTSLLPTSCRIWRRANGPVRPPDPPAIPETIAATTRMAPPRAAVARIIALLLFVNPFVVLRRGAQQVSKSTGLFPTSHVCASQYSLSFRRAYT